MPIEVIYIRNVVLFSASGALLVHFLSSSPSYFLTEDSVKDSLIPSSSRRVSMLFEALIDDR